MYGICFWYLNVLQRSLLESLVFFEQAFNIGIKNKSTFPLNIKFLNLISILWKLNFEVITFFTNNLSIKSILYTLSGMNFLNRCLFILREINFGKFYSIKYTGWSENSDLWFISRPKTLTKISFTFSNLWICINVIGNVKSWHYSVMRMG